MPAPSRALPAMAMGPRAAVVAGGPESPVLRWVCERLAPSLAATTGEIGAVLAAFDGRFIAPGPSGAPSRGMAHVLPTGRNFYALDPKAVPSRLAWDVGRRLAELVCNVTSPRRTGIRPGGAGRVGDRGDAHRGRRHRRGAGPAWVSGPCWAEGSGRVEGVELIPSPRARPAPGGRHRCGCRGSSGTPSPTWSSCSTRRFGWPPPPRRGRATNPVARVADEPRIFGPSRARTVRASSPSSRVGRLAERRRPGRGLPGLGRAGPTGPPGRAPPGRRRVRDGAGGIEVAVKNQDNREHDIFDSDDYLQDHGGMVAAVRALRAGRPKAFFGDSANPARPRVRSLAEEAARVVRTPGAQPEVDRRPWSGTATRGPSRWPPPSTTCSATTPPRTCVEDWMYERVTEAYVGDAARRKFFEESNPWALRAIAERLLEAAERGLWAPSDEATLHVAPGDPRGRGDGGGPVRRGRPVFPMSALVGLDDLVLALVLAASTPRSAGCSCAATRVRPRRPPPAAWRRSCPPARRLSRCRSARPRTGWSARSTSRRSWPRGSTASSPACSRSADGGVLYVDEVNLLADHLVDVLLDVAATGVNRVERDGVSHAPSEPLRADRLDEPRGGRAAAPAARPLRPLGPGPHAESTRARAEAVRRRLAFDADPARFVAAWASAEADLARGARRDPVPLEPGLERCGCGAVRRRRRRGAAGRPRDLPGRRRTGGWRGEETAGDEEIVVVAPLVVGHRRRTPFGGAAPDPAELDELVADVLGSHAMGSARPPAGAATDHEHCRGAGRRRRRGDPGRRLRRWGALHLGRPVAPDRRAAGGLGSLGDPEPVGALAGDRAGRRGRVEVARGSRHPRGGDGWSGPTRCRPAAALPARCPVPPRWRPWSGPRGPGRCGSRTMISDWPGGSAGATT